MKKIFTILILFIVTSVVHAQDEYKDYKPCTECFDKWHKPVIQTHDSSGMPVVKSDNGAKKALKNLVGWTVALVATVFTYTVYNKLTQTANEVTY